MQSRRAAVFSGAMWCRNVLLHEVAIRRWTGQPRGHTRAGLPLRATPIAPHWHPRSAVARFSGKQPPQQWSAGLVRRCADCCRQPILGIKRAYSLSSGGAQWAAERTVSAPPGRSRVRQGYSSRTTTLDRHVHSNRRCWRWGCLIRATGKVDDPPPRSEHCGQSYLVTGRRGGRPVGRRSRERW